MKRRPVRIVDQPLKKCLACGSALPTTVCPRCHREYMPFDSWLMNCNKVTVTNFEECIKIFKRRIVELRKEVATTEAPLREQIDPEPLFDTESSDIVYVYHQLNNNCVRYNHPTESVTVLTIDIRTRKNVNVNAYYCKSVATGFK